MIRQFQTYNENIFKPKKLKGRAAGRKMLAEKKAGAVKEFIQKHEEEIKKKTKAFKYSSIDSEDLEQVVNHFMDEKSMLEYFDIDDIYEQGQADTFINLYIMGVLLKDKIKVGKFFDWKEESQCVSYVKRNLKQPWKYAYNAYPGGDGTAVVFSKIKLESCEVAINEDYED